MEGRKGTPGREHGMGKGLAGRNSFGQTLWSLHPVWVRAVATGKGQSGANQLEPGAALEGQTPP